MRRTNLAFWLMTLCAGAALGASDMLTAVRPLDRHTPLAANGRAPALLLPADAGYDTAAGLLLNGLAVAGVRAERVKDVATAEPAARTVICLGSMVNNALIERLYWNRYTFVDALTPGPGQFLLQTIYDPYPFCGGQNVIIIGGSDPAGAALGVKRFLTLLTEGRWPYVLEVGPQAPVSAAQARKILAAKPAPTFLEALANANRYLQTGCEAHARQAIRALEAMAALYAPGGQRAAGTSLRYQRLPFDEEMAAWEILCAWDAFEECPLISDAQRLAFSNVLLRFTRELQQYCSEYDEIDERYRVSWNHTTFPLLGIHFGARYFQRYYQLADMPGMLAKARTCFLAQARSWKPQEDADIYLTFTTEHAYIHCMAEDRMDQAVVANLRRTADYVVGWNDNQGRSSGFGDATSMATERFLGDKLLPLALWWSRDGGYRWLMERYTDGRWRNPYERGVAAVRPDRFTGVNVFAMDPQVYAFTQTHSSYHEPLTPAEVPAGEAFDKITFRENWDRGGQYLILDGLARGKHLHHDGNSITEFVEGGERWLLDHDYLTQNTTEHSMLSILRNGRCDQLMPSLAGLAAWADLPDCGYTHTYLKNYNGCDWRRQILWRKGGWFLVADTVTPRAAGDYTFDLTWKTIDHDGQQRVDARGDFVATRVGNGKNTQGPVRQFFIKPAEAVSSWVSNHVRPRILVPVSILHQRQTGALRGGQPTRFVSLVFTSRPEQPRDLRPVSVADQLLAIQGGAPGLALLGNVDVAGLTARVEAGLLTARSLAFCGLQRFQAGELAIESSAAVDLELDLTTGKATVQAAPSGAQISFALAGRRHTVSLHEGRNQTSLNAFHTPLQAVAIMEALIQRKGPSLEQRAAQSGPTDRPQWSAFEPDGQIACVKTADLGDGKGPRVFVCRGNALHCLSPEGQPLWTFRAGGPTSDVAFGELRAHPGQEILLGSADTYLYLLAADGTLLEKNQLHGIQYARTFGDKPYAVCHVGVWDINGDGQNEIVATLMNFDLQALTSAWKPLWKVHYALHGSRQLSFEDLHGAGRPDTLLVADRYGNCVGADPDGKEIYRGVTAIGDVAYVVANLDGGRGRQVITGSSTGELIATQGIGRTEPLWRFDNFGYAVNRLRAADLDGTGRQQVIVASGTGCLYVLDAAGKVLWRDRVGQCVNDALVLGKPGEMQVAYCDESGPVRIADGKGKLLRALRPPSPARLLTVLSTPHDRWLMLALADGRLVAYTIP